MKPETKRGGKDAAPISCTCRPPGTYSTVPKNPPRYIEWASRKERAFHRNESVGSTDPTKKE